MTVIVMTLGRSKHAGQECRVTTAFIAHAGVPAGKHQRHQVVSRRREMPGDGSGTWSMRNGTKLMQGDICVMFSGDRIMLVRTTHA